MKLRKQRDAAWPVKPTRTTRRWLLVLLTDAANIRGSTIWQVAGGNAVRVYGMLDKLEDAGWVTGERESPEPLDRPRRRFYRLTPFGRAQALAMLRLKEGRRDAVETAEAGQ